MISLKEQKKILKDNIKYEKKMIDNNESYDNEQQNVSYGPNHYKKAIEYDKKDLEEVNNKIDMIDRINKLKEKRNKVLKTKRD